MRGRREGEGKGEEGGEVEEGQGGEVEVRGRRECKMMLTMWCKTEDEMVRTECTVGSKGSVHVLEECE